MKPHVRQSIITLLVLLSIILAACAQAQPTPQAATEAPPAEEPAEPAEVEPAQTEPAAPAATEAPAPTEPPAAEQVTLKVMHNYAPDDTHNPVLMRAFENFMKANPDIKIEDEIYSDLDIPLKVETAFMAGQEPDIVFNNWASSKKVWIDQGVSIPVDDLMVEWGFEGKFIPEALKAATDPKGRLVAFPLEGFTWPVWYNTDILEKAGVGVPKTVDELIEASKKIREAGYEPFVTGGTDWSGYAVFTSIVQLTLSDEEMREVFGKGGFAENENAMEGIRLFTRLRDEGVFATNTEGLQADAMNAMFFAEQAAMMQAGAWSFGSLPEEMHDRVALGGFPILAADSPHEKPIIYAGFGKGVWITRNGAQKLDAARKFIQYIFSEEVITDFVVETAMASPINTIEIAPGQLSPFMQSTIDYVKDATIVDITDNYVPQDAWDALYKASALAFIPGTTPEEIAAEWDKIYEEQQ
jgi:multiple sugar transport system substrate-binding protein